jgi:4-amino-4-deoxy-L-arabinose transferase-like glycosyltransferase
MQAHRAATRGWESDLVLWLAAAGVLAVGIGLRDPMPPDEPRFVLMARHMVESGDWLIPRRGHELYGHKPPVFMWLQALAYLVVRDWRVAFLLPSLAAALGTLWLVKDLTARLFTPRAGRYALLALLATVQFVLQAKKAQIDAVVMGCMTLSLYGLLRHLLLGPAPRWYLAGWFFAGVGTVTKGVGFLPLLVLLPWLYARRAGWRLPAVRVGALSVAGLFAFVAGTAVWLGPMLFTVATSADPALVAYANEILFKQTATRYANAWHHVQPPWYYLVVIATLWLPTALALPALVPAWWRRVRRRDARHLLPLAWALLVLLFFSASPGKREVYILPMLPALAIAAGPLVPGLLRRKALRAAFAAFVAVLALAALGLGVAALVGTPRWELRLVEQRGLAPADLEPGFAALVALGVGGLALLWWYRDRVARALLAFVAALWVVYGVSLMPAVEASSSGRAIMQKAVALLEPSTQLGLVGWREQHLLHAPPGAAEFGFERPAEGQWQDALAWLAAAPQRRIVFADAATLVPCVDRAATRTVGVANRRTWLLVPAAAVRNCGI